MKVLVTDSDGIYFRYFFTLRLPDYKRLKTHARKSAVVHKEFIPEIKRRGLYNIEAIEDSNGLWFYGPVKAEPDSWILYMGDTPDNVVTRLCKVVRQRLKVKPGKKYRLEVTKVQSKVARGKAT